MSLSDFTHVLRTNPRRLPRVGIVLAMYVRSKTIKCTRWKFLYRCAPTVLSTKFLEYELDSFLLLIHHINVIRETILIIALLRGKPVLE